MAPLKSTMDPSLGPLGSVEEEGGHLVHEHTKYRELQSRWLGAGGRGGEPVFHKDVLVPPGSLPCSEGLSCGLLNEL